MPRRVPPDVARVLDTFRALGEAARRGLHVSEKLAKHDVQAAARHAARLAEAERAKRP